MATAAEIQAQIDAVEADIARRIVETDQAGAARALAIERQLLRRRLDSKQRELFVQTCHRDNLILARGRIDDDICGPHAPNGPLNEFSANRSVSAVPRQVSHCNDVLDPAPSILEGELEWSIRHFSWLLDGLEENDTDYAVSNALQRGPHSFQLCYHPKHREMGDQSQRASLAILHAVHDGNCQDGIRFRYKLMVKSRDRGFVEWEANGHGATNEDVEGCLFGPDVCGLHEVPSGIFGLTHDQLIQSEWVVNDILTVKLKVEVRIQTPLEEITEVMPPLVHVPPSSLSDDFLSLLDSGANSDVTFTLQGEAVHAHSSVLCARSVVLQRQFTCGLQESSSKVVAIEDCDPTVFKAFLRYLYSDDSVGTEKILTEHKEDGSSGGSACLKKEIAMPALQQLLALAHKYQISRLLLWCENNLSRKVSIDTVCNVLCQAHLYEATNLEKKCLEVIKQNMKEVFATEAFISLHQKWPQVALKITAHMANVPEAKTVEALEVQLKTGKRKRDD